MSDGEEELLEISVELADENGTISEVDLPDVQPAVTLTVYAKRESGRKYKLEILIEVDDDGEPKFALQAGEAYA